MEVTLPYVVAPSMFHDLYVDLFGGDQDLEVYKPTQELDNTSLVAGRALWALIRKVKADPELTMLISEADAAHVMRMLSHSEKDSGFIAYIEEFLCKYGMRSDTVIEMSAPVGLRSQRRPSNFSRTICPTPPLTRTSTGEK
jgi:hypothetical protein